MLVITNSPTTQLVTLNIQSDRVTDIEGIEGVVADLDTIVGTVEALEEYSAVIELVECIYVAPPVFDIDSFATPVTLVEIGALVSSPTFTASYSDPPDTAVLTDNDGNPAKNVITTPTAFSSDYDFQKTVNNGSVQFTLTATKDAQGDSAVVTIRWQPRVFWGVGGATLLTEAEIEALAGDALDNNFSRAFSLGPMGPAEYVWYCFPQSYDPLDGAQFQVGPFIGGFYKVGVVSVTNPNGVTQDYACWRSDFPGLDAITVTVF